MTDQQQELYAKSSAVATMLGIINGVIFIADEEHLRRVVIGLRQQTDVENTLAMLNPGHDPQKAELLMANADAIEKLLALRETLKECARIRDSIKEKAIV